MKTKLMTAVGLCVAAGLAVPSQALAQKQAYQSVDASARATYGDYRLNAGFADDPYIIYVTSGGDIDASNVASGCVGMVSRAPDAQLTYSAGSLPLIIRTSSSNDTTLLINGPNGDWHCDDDSGGGTNAEISWSNPGSGVYDIWVGAYGGNSGAAELRISELYSGSNSGNGISSLTSGLGGAGGTFGGISLRSGFSPDPHTINLTAGGGVDASRLGTSCVGMVADDPDYIVTYQAGSLPLIFGVDADRDTTLVVADDNDNVWCDDDGGDEPLNPRVRINTPRSSEYRVWVGTYSSGNSPATLYVTELSSNAP
jgi:hypothetical protein